MAWSILINHLFNGILSRKICDALSLGRSQVYLGPFCKRLEARNPVAPSHPFWWHVNVKMVSWRRQQLVAQRTRDQKEQRWGTVIIPWQWQTTLESIEQTGGNFFRVSVISACWVQWIFPTSKMCLPSKPTVSHARGPVFLLIYLSHIAVDPVFVSKTVPFIVPRFSHSSECCHGRTEDQLLRI